VTDAASMTASSRSWRVVLLAALAAILAVLLPAGTASASGLPAAETRVGAISPTVSHVVGVAEHIAAGQHWVRGPSQLRPVVGNCVAAEEGIYVVRSEAGTYVGQSGNITQRLAQHVGSEKFTQEEVDAAERTAVMGGKTSREIAEQLKIDESGGIEGLLNQVNPIGPRRFDLLPDGYFR